MASLLILVAAGGLWGQASASAPDPPATAQVAQLHEAFFKAMMARDTAALGRLIADDVLFINPAGQAETKQVHIEKVRKGELVFESYERRALSTTFPSPGTALVHSSANVSGFTRKIPFRARFSTLTVWIRKGGVWRMNAYHANVLRNIE